MLATGLVDILSTGLACFVVFLAKFSSYGEHFSGNAHVVISVTQHSHN